MRVQRIKKLASVGSRRLMMPPFEMLYKWNNKEKMRGGAYQKQGCMCG